MVFVMKIFGLHVRYDADLKTEQGTAESLSKRVNSGAQRKASFRVEYKSGEYCVKLGRLKQ